MQLKLEKEVQVFVFEQQQRRLSYWMIRGRKALYSGSSLWSIKIKEAEEEFEEEYADWACSEKEIGIGRYWCSIGLAVGDFDNCRLIFESKASGFLREVGEWLDVLSMSTGQTNKSFYSGSCLLVTVILACFTSDSMLVFCLRSRCVNQCCAVSDQKSKVRSYTFTDFSHHLVMQNGLPITIIDYRYPAYF